MSESSQLSPTPSPPPTMPPKPGPKRYRPPQPDSNTFDTQAAFLDSLQTVAIETVDEEHRKCAHCWKYYGESDPGFDNAEAPVRLRCNHVFGEKCLKDLFGLPEPVKINLVQLTYQPGSKGADLGRRLSAWVDHCGVEKGALMLGGNREKDFTKLLNEFQSQPVAEKALGPEWCSIFVQALMPRPSVEKVHILENAIIYDIVPVPSRVAKKTAGLDVQWTSIPAQSQTFLGGTPNSLPSFYSSFGPGSSLPQGWTSYEVAAMTASETSSNASSESEVANSSLQGQASVSEESVVHKSAADSKPGGYYAEPPKVNPYAASDSIFNIPLGAVAKPPSFDASKKKAKQQFKKITSKFQASEPAVAPTPHASEEELAPKLQAEELKLKDTIEQLDDPTLFPFLPHTIHSAIAAHSASSTPETLAPPVSYSLPGSQPATTIIQGFTVEESSPPKASEAFLSMLSSEAKEAAKKSEQKEIVPGTWKDNIPETSNLDKLVALQKKQKKAEKAVKAAKKAKEAQKVHHEAAEKRAVKMKGISRHLDMFGAPKTPCMSRSWPANQINRGTRSPAEGDDRQFCCRFPGNIRKLRAIQVRRGTQFWATSPN
jgi:hypothetical protein